MAQYTPMYSQRHGRACPGHPRLASRRYVEGVDARDERGHDEGVRFPGFRVAQSGLLAIAFVIVLVASIVALALTLCLDRAPRRFFQTAME
jgi:hypothetical protein